MLSPLMHVRPCSEPSNHQAVSRSGPHFGWNAGMAIDTPQGINGKVAIYDDAWHRIGGTSEPQWLTVRHQPIAPNTLAQKITQAFIQTASRCAQLIPGNQTAGNTLVFFLPSQLHNGVLDWIDNGSDPVKNFDFKPVLGQIAAALSRSANPLLSLNPNAKVILLNDMAGGSAAAIAKLARQHPDKFKPGLDAVYLMSSGGLGMSGITYEDDGQTRPLVRFQMTEIAAMPHPRRVSNGEFVMGRRLGADIYALLEDFTQALPPRYPDAQKTTLRHMLNGKIATDYQTAVRFLPGLSLSEFQAAACFGVRDYMDSLACNLRDKIATGNNLAILGGTMAAGLRDFVNANPALFATELQQYSVLMWQNKLPPNNGPKSAFDKVFMVRLYGQLNDFARMLIRNEGFDVVSDLDIADNTEGTPYIAQGWFQNRSDRFAVPAEVFSS